MSHYYLEANMAMKNKDIYATYFRVEATDEKSHKCLECNAIIHQNIKKGYTNVVNHVILRHPDFHDKMLCVEKHLKEGGDLNTFFSKKINPQAVNYYKWMEWIAMGDEPFTIVENPWVRKNTNLQPIGRKSLMFYFHKIHDVVKDKISKMLPKTFGIIFDGWSIDTEHYIAIFATWTTVNDDVKHVLIKCGVQEDPEPGQILEFTADDIGDFIFYAFDEIGRSDVRDLETIEFLSGDNCSTNVSLARKLRCPLVGCNSHKLNLAVQTSFINSERRELVNKVDRLMSELRTLKNAGIVRSVTFITPIRKNATRWSSTYNMLSRYVELEPFLPLCTAFPNTVLGLIPSAVESQAIKEICAQLKKFDSVCKKLQKEDGVDLHNVRTLFKALQESFPSDIMPHLSPVGGNISHFENGVVKILSGDESFLNKDEKLSLRKFKINKDNLADEEESPVIIDDDDFAGSVLYAEHTRKKAKIDKDRNTSAYRSLKHISPTSNIVERLFSRAKLIMTDRRKHMDPDNLDMLLCLRMNSDLWSAEDIENVMVQQRAATNISDIAAADMAAGSILNYCTAQK
jgi:hypothetical protein